jgi:hypothetical protein
MPSNRAVSVALSVVASPRATDRPPHSSALGRKRLLVFSRVWIVDVTAPNSEVTDVVTDAKGVIETVVFRQLYLKHIDENLFIYFADFSRANRRTSCSDPEYLDSGKPEKDLWQRNLNWLREVAD